MLVIINEISMVSSKLFYQIHKRLNEIFGSRQDVPLRGKYVLVCRDLSQLPAVHAKPVFTFSDTETIADLDVWIYCVNSDWQRLIKQ